jgi:phosphatidylglycerophosphatase A
VKRWIVTLGGCGYLPASGTWASLLTVLILWPIFQWIGPATLLQTAAALISTLFFCALNLALGGWAIEHFGDKDPGKFVLDEAAGVSLTLVALPGVTAAALAIKLAAAFIAFRIFDITKIPPIRRLEKLPGAWGILVDDLGAAVYANVLCQIVLRWGFKF